MKKNGDYWKFWRRCLPYYLAFVLVVLVVVSICFILVYRQTYKSHVQLRQEQFDSALEMMDDEFLSYENVALFLYGSPSTSRIAAKTSFESEDIVNLREYKNLLQTPFLDNRNVAGYYLYFPLSGLTFDASRTYFSFEECYDDFGSFASLSAKEALSSIVLSRTWLPSPALEFVSEGGHREQVLPITLLPNVSSVSFTLLLSTRLFDNLLPSAKVSVSQDSGLVLYDSGLKAYLADHEVPLYDRNNPDYGGKDGVLLSGFSRYLGFEITALVTKGEIFAQVSPFLRTYAILFSSITLGVIVVLLIISFFVFSPFYRMSNELEKQKPAAVKFYLNRLLDANASDDEIAQAVSSFALDSSLFHFVLVLKPLTDAKLGELPLVRRELETLCPGHLAVKRDGPMYRTMIALCYNDTAEGLYFARLSEWAQREANSSLAVGFGLSYKDSRNISISLLEAEKTATYLENNDGGCMRYDQLPSSDDVVTFDGELRNKTQTLISAGEGEKAASLICEHFDISRQMAFSLNSGAANCIIAQLVSILIAEIKEFVPDSEKQNQLLSESVQLFQETSPQHLMTRYQDLILKIASFVHVRREDGQSLSDDIVQYIDTHYNDINMSLVKLGCEFYMNESYISQYFKVHTGSNFSQYLEKVRMDHAVALLSKDEMTIAQIVEAVGYTNRNTFYKAFLRVYGVSPKVYKERILRPKNAVANADGNA